MFDFGIIDTHLQYKEELYKLFRKNGEDFYHV
jgi:hypothetical protein